MSDKIPFRLTKPQLTILRDPHRFKIVNAGRRFGKSFVSGAAILEQASIPNSVIWYVAPTWDMAKKIMWDDWLPKHVPKEWVTEVNKMDKTYKFINGSILYVLSADNPDHLRGTSLNRVILDECGFMKDGVWEIIRPALADRKGDAILVSTPKGYNWFYKMYKEALEQPDWKAFQYTTIDGGNVDADEIEAARQTMSPKMFAQEFLASFENLASRVYDMFDREKNICELDENWGKDSTDVHIGIDFNVNPMTAAIAVKERDDIFFFDEIVEPNSNTQILCNSIRKKFPKADIFVYPDPTCRKRQTSAAVGETDYEILRRNRFHVCCPKAPYSSRDKFNAVNTAFLNASGDRHAFITKGRCKKLKEALEGYCYKDNGEDTDKSSGLDHISDAAAYLLCYLKPIKRSWGLNRPKVYGY